MALQDFLNNLSDSELAFLYTYKGSSYLPESAERIDKELSKRHMDSEQIKEILKRITFNKKISAVNAVIRKSD